MMGEEGASFQHAWYKYGRTWVSFLHYVILSCKRNLFNFFCFTGKRWFSNSATAWGYTQFMFLNDLNDAFKGFLVNDTIIVEAEIIVMSIVK